MARNPETLPEGADSIIDLPATEVTFDPDAQLESGAGTAPGFTPSPALTEEISDAGPTGTRERVTAKVGEKTADIRAQAGDKAREYALLGKDKTTGALDDFVRMLGDGASTLDDKIGAQYGDYARRAAEAVSGLSSTLREKDVDELFADARDAVRKSPAIAIGAAAALGFVVARLVKAGTAETDTTPSDRAS